MHVRCKDGDPTNIPGVEQYFDWMRAAGYPAPREGGDSIDGTGLSRFSHMRMKIRDDNRQLFAIDESKV